MPFLAFRMTTHIGDNVLLPIITARSSPFLGFARHAEQWGEEIYLLIEAARLCRRSRRNTVESGKCFLSASAVRYNTIQCRLGIPLGASEEFDMAVPEKQAFKRVVLVEHFRPGVWSVGFVTGHLDDPRSGDRLLKIFVPQGPNPTSGFMLIVKEPQVREIGWSVAEAMNAVISGGLSGPDQLD